MRPKYMEYSTETSNRGKKKRREKVNIETRKDNKSKPQAGEGEKAWFRANKLLMNCKLCLQKHKNFFLSKKSTSNKMESNPNCQFVLFNRKTSLALQQILHSSRHHPVDTT